MVLHQENGNLRLNRDSFEVIVRAKGGLTLPRIARDAELTRFDRPLAIAFLQIGGNDLCRTEVPMSVVCSNILAFAEYLRDGVGIHQVIVGQLLRRQIWASCVGYNDRVAEINNQLRAQTQESDRVGIRFWHHRGFWDAHLSHLADDGVHLKYSSENTATMTKYLQSIKSAIIF